MNLSFKNGLPWCNLIFFYLLMGIPLYAQISPSKASDIPVDLNTTADTAYEISRIQGKEYAFTLVFKNKRTGEIRTRITSEELMKNNPFYALDYPILSTKPNGERIYDLRGLSRNKRINILSQFKLNPEFNGYEIDSILPNYASVEKVLARNKNKNTVIVNYYLEFYYYDPSIAQIPLGAMKEIVLYNCIGQESYRLRKNSYGDDYPSFDGRFVLIKEFFPGGEGSFGWNGDLVLFDLSKKKALLILDLIKGSGLMDCLKCYYQNDKYYMNFEDGSNIISLVVDPYLNKYYIKKYLSGKSFSDDDYYRIKKNIKKINLNLSEYKSFEFSSKK
ncbi:MAG: hypothetical protein KGS48_04825 [Bacteroidetes bacterium]|nr:hypothetical protein [Bacteroidota bacterium]